MMALKTVRIIAGVLLAGSASSTWAQELTPWYEAPFVGGAIESKKSGARGGPVFIDVAHYRWVQQGSTQVKTVEYDDWRFAPGSPRMDRFYLHQIRPVCVKAGSEECELIQLVGVAGNSQKILLSPIVFSMNDRSLLRAMRREVKGEFWYEPFMITQAMGSACIAVPLLPLGVLVDIIMIPAGVVSYPAFKISQITRRLKLKRLFRENRVARLHTDHLWELLGAVHELNDQHFSRVK